MATKPGGFTVGGGKVGASETAAAGVEKGEFCFGKEHEELRAEKWSGVQCAFTVHLCPLPELQVTLDQPGSLSELQFLPSCEIGSL